MFTKRAMTRDIDDHCLPSSAGDCMLPVQRKACKALMHGCGATNPRRRPVSNSVIMQSSCTVTLQLSFSVVLAGRLSASPRGYGAQLA